MFVFIIDKALKNFSPKILASDFLMLQDSF